MLINLKSSQIIIFLMKTFFFILENDDLCLRIKKKWEYICY